MEIYINDKKMNVLIADDDRSRQSGLMYISKLPDDCGMLFSWPEIAIRSFWMKNTKIPLDIAYISEDGVILEIKPLTPFDLKSVTSNKSVMFALETNSGWFSKNGIDCGDVVRGLR